MKKYTFTTVFLVVALCGVGVLCLCYVDGNLPSWPGTAYWEHEHEVTPEKSPLVNVYEQAVRDTVMVHMYDEYGRKVGHGSGVVISADGIVATARHCVQGFDAWVVEFADGSMVTVTDHIYDLDDDCALLYTKKECDTFAEIAVELDMRIGDEVFIVGTPYDHVFTDMVTIGYFSRAAQFMFDGDYFLANCSAYPGNSGGGVFNARGQVIGLLVAGPKEFVDISMCTPIDEIIDLLRQRAEGIR